MKTLVSFVLGAALLFGAATFGSPSGSASARANTRDRHDKNWRHHHHKHHHRHHRGRKLSY
jgi:Ni/Co efflux regulator RcnB